MVDNEEPIRTILVRILTRQGWKVVAVDSGEAALSACKPTEFCFAFIDMELGEGMTGIEVARKLRALDSKLPLALMTGSPNYTEAVQNLNLGPLLSKPFDSNEVLSLLRANARTS